MGNLFPSGAPIATEIGNLSMQQNLVMMLACVRPPVLIMEVREGNNYLYVELIV